MSSFASTPIVSPMAGPSASPSVPVVAIAASGMSTWAQWLLWFIVIAIIVWFILYVLKPSWVMKCDVNGKPTNEVDPVKTFFAALIIALLILLLIYAIRGPRW